MIWNIIQLFASSFWIFLLKFFHLYILESSYFLHSGHVLFITCFCYIHRLHSYVPPVQTFTSITRHAMYTGLTHFYSLCIFLIRRKFHSDSFYFRTVILWNGLTRIPRRLIWRQLKCHISFVFGFLNNKYSWILSRQILN